MVAGFGVPHTPVFPFFVKRDGPDCEIAKLFGPSFEVCGLNMQNYNERMRAEKVDEMGFPAA